jgi:hypothetical protein
MKQVEISFDAGLLDQYPAFIDVVRAAVYGCGRQFKAIAADLDMTSSELSRKLANNPNDPVHFPLDRLPELIAATNDNRPIHWLVESFIESPEHRRTRAIDDLHKLLPKIQMALNAAKLVG